MKKYIIIFFVLIVALSQAQVKKWTLEECVIYALENNISIKQSGLDLKEIIQIGDQEFERKYLELGISDGVFVEIKSGITKDDKIKVWNQIQGVPNYAQNN